MTTTLPPTLFLTDSDVAAASDWRAAVEALRDAYAADVTEDMVPPRSMARGDGCWLRSLTAISPSGRLGAKLIAASPKNRFASYLIPLFNGDTMALEALLDGNRVTGIRTAATSALAVDLLAPNHPLKVGILGSGFEARNHLAALAAVRDIASVKVFSPTPAKREAFARELCESQGLAINACEQPEAVATDVDVVICAARSRDETPIIEADWLTPGTVVVSIGSTLPEQREVGVDTLRRASLMVCDMPEEVLHDTGDLSAARDAGLDMAPRTCSLHQLLSGDVSADAGDGILLYKSVGSALQDIATAEMLLARARELGLGTTMPVTIAPVAK